MNDVVVTLGLGILTNAIYDIIKHIGAKIHVGKRVKSNDLRKVIENKLYNDAPEGIKPLLTSTIFAEYFSSAQFLDMINAYIEYKLVYNYTNKNSKIEKALKKSAIICSQDLVEFIGDNIHALYVEQDAETTPNLTEIKNTITYIIDFAEQTAAKALSSDAKRLLYLINNHIDSCCNEIINVLTKLQQTVAGIQSKQLTKKNDEYEETKCKYYSVLKDKHSDAHIYLLDKFPFEKFYVAPKLQRVSTKFNPINALSVQEYHQRNLISWNDIFTNDNIVYLTGGAGYGKSLFTKKIINNYNELNIFHAEEYLVIYGELKAFYPNGTDSALGVIEFLKESIKNNTLMTVSNDFIEYYLNSGRCIILLDALDEVDKQKRNSLHESVVAFFKNQNPNNKICITTRDRGFIPERDVEVFKIRSLDEQQVEKYVDKIIALGKFEQEDKEPFMSQSCVLVEKGFLNSFLVLSLLINIYKGEQKLPENKLELYQKCFEYIANRREKSKTQKEFDWRSISPIMKDNTFIELAQMGMPNNSNIDRYDIKAKLLEVYRSKYVSEAEAENAIDEFLKFCSDRTELFVPTTEDKYKFFHRSFFEYFYSLYIFLRCDSAEKVLSEFQKFDVDSEVFELTVAMLKLKDEEKYQALVALLFSKSYSEFDADVNEFPFFNMLVLSMQVIDDVSHKTNFLKIILDHKEHIFKQRKKIHNLRLIPNIFEGDEEAYKKICDEYYDECLNTILHNFNFMFSLAEQIYDHEDDFWTKFKSIKNGFRNPISLYKLSNEDNNFLMSVYSRTYSCKDTLCNLSDDTIMSVYKKYSRYNYKKKTEQTRKNLNIFANLSSEQQDSIADWIVYCDTIL